MILKYCHKGLAFQETVPAPTLFTGVDAEVQGAVASNIICGSSSMVEYLPSKQVVASSSLVYRSRPIRLCVQLQASHVGSFGKS